MDGGIKKLCKILPTFYVIFYYYVEKKFPILKGLTGPIVPSWDLLFSTLHEKKPLGSFFQILTNINKQKDYKHGLIKFISILYRQDLNE